LKPGQVVRVIESAFAGLDAIFAESDDRRRCFILLSLLGKTHRVAISLSALASAA
jgi:transcription antitermination factor NusG